LQTAKAIFLAQLLEAYIDGGVGYAHPGTNVLLGGIKVECTFTDSDG
jgi:hypothetical protein